MFNLYLTPNDPEETLLVSSDGVVHYKVTTSKPNIFNSCAKTTIESPQGANGVRSVAVIKWRRWSHPSVRTDIFDGIEQEMELREFLYKLDGKFTSTRYFLGSDDIEYRWKDIAYTGPILCNRRTKHEIARFTQELQPDGYTHSERRWFLQIQNTSLPIDMIVLTFIILEKRRRDRIRNPNDTLHDEEPIEGGCGEC
ncbi:hypothetical protein QCA50_007676 [Cerrena zonata]|uniref:DUF6593 domain-containing protein n=1 Tax=Cerrena zonata TaxID=2478898 RepID=A0AAW0GCV5_9APHY